MCNDNIGVEMALEDDVSTIWKLKRVLICTGNECRGIGRYDTVFKVMFVLALLWHSKPIIQGVATEAVLDWQSTMTNKNVWAK